MLYHFLKQVLPAIDELAVKCHQSLPHVKTMKQALEQASDPPKTVIAKNSSKTDGSLIQWAEQSLDFRLNQGGH